MNKNSDRPVTAADVREWFAKHPSKVPAEAAHTVAKSAKGRLHPAAREAFNKHSGMTYDEGTGARGDTISLPYVKFNSRGARLKREAVLPKSEIRVLAGEVGKRGRISAESLAKASEAYTAKVNV